MVIWKFYLSGIIGRQLIEMPTGAEPLKVHASPVNVDGCYLWALVDPYAAKVQRRFSIVGTGHAVPPAGKYVGTYFSDPYVWHVFDCGEEAA